MARTVCISCWAPAARCASKRFPNTPKPAPRGFMMETCGRSGIPGEVRHTRRTAMREAGSNFSGGNEPQALSSSTRPIANASFTAMRSPQTQAGLIFHHCDASRNAARLNPVELHAAYITVQRLCAAHEPQRWLFCHTCDCRKHPLGESQPHIGAATGAWKRGLLCRLM